jgi:DNA-binding response OmpR family regulator
MSERILIVDDDPELCEMLRDYLQGEGFEPHVASDGVAGVERALGGEWAAILLDVMMPDLNGVDALRQIRERSRVPVIMLTAKGDDVDRIVGLELGADDYLPKPFNPRELLARLRAVLRRSGTDEEELSQVMQIGKMEIDCARRRVFIDGEELEVTSTEFTLLEILGRASGQPVSKEVLSDKGLGRRLRRYDRGVDMHISNIRRKLRRALISDSLIMTVRGKGYQLVGD